MEEDGHGVLNCDGINGFEGMFDGSHGDFEVGFKSFHRWGVGSSSGPSCDDNKRFDFPSSGSNTIN